MLQHKIWLVEENDLVRRGLKTSLATFQFIVSQDVRDMSALASRGAEPAPMPEAILISAHSLLDRCDPRRIDLASVCYIFAGVPVIVLSHSVSVRQLISVMNAGASAYLSHGIDANAIAQALRLAISDEPDHRVESTSHRSAGEYHQHPSG